MTDLKPASAKSINYLAALMSVPQDDNFAEWALAMEEMGQAHVSSLITSLKAAPKPVQAPVVPQVARGEWHVYGDKETAGFYFIARSQSSGNLYTKRRTATGFEFAPGILKYLSAATKVGPQHAEAIASYGHMFERCMFCRLPLDVPESRQYGYGEKCASNHGLPYGS